jgi:hypothetical protein
MRVYIIPEQYVHDWQRQFAKKPGLLYLMWIWISTIFGYKSNDTRRMNG